MTTTVAASTLAPGDILDGRPIGDVFRSGRRVHVAPHGWSYDDLDSVVIDRRAADACSACYGPLDPTVFHQDTPAGDPLCEDCCGECNPDLPDGDEYDRWVERRLTAPAYLCRPDTLTGLVGR